VTSPVTANSERLVDILADMVRSAIAWEEQYGEPPVCENHDRNALTGIPRSIQLAAHNMPLDGGHEHDDNDANKV
jgi:hypothetical protein